MTRILIVIGVLIAAACAQTTASLSPEQCEADWASVGAADGREGAREAKLAAYETACARGGAGLAMADAEAWRRGWRQGLREFCASDPAGDDEAAAASRRDNCAFEVVASAPADDRRRTRRSPDIDYGSPTIRPRVGLGVGVGSGGVRLGGGVGVGVGIFDFGLFF